MYLDLGPSAVVPTAEIVGIFDLDNSSWAFKTREFLERAEREGRAVWLTGDLPRSFVLCRDGRIYITQLSTSALRGRAEGMIGVQDQFTHRIPRAHSASL